jgi:aquaporin Z
MLPFIGEFLGTMFFTFVVFATQSPVAIGIALTIGILLVKAAFGSEHHFNPAVTIAEVAAGQMPASSLLPSIVAQIAGALIGLEFYKHLGVVSTQGPQPGR